MEAVSITSDCPTNAMEIPCERPRWYAVYTCANHERAVAGQLSRRGVENFLPVFQVERRWSDRRVKLEIPLFTGYVFVRLELRDRLKVLEVPGVVRLVGFAGVPAALSDEQIGALRTGSRRGLSAKPHPYLSLGKRVKLIYGPFAGMEGILLRRKAKLRVVISIDLIQRSIVIDVDEADLGLDSQTRTREVRSA